MAISEQAAVHLAETKVRTVGVDYLSVGGYHADGATIHKILLGAGIWISRAWTCPRSPAAGTR
jgi:arylformamidase